MSLAQRQDRNLHAQASLRRQRLWHAYTHVDLGKGAKTSSPRQIRRALPDGLYYIGGLIKHARALSALGNPTTNSYKRLVPGFESPVNMAYSSRNRSAAIRIPMFSTNPKSKRVEYRTPTLM